MTGRTPILALAACAAGVAAAGTATAGSARDATVAVLVFARGGADANQAVRIERDLRQMFDHAHQEGRDVPRSKSIEPRFDVGKLSKADIEKARRHFNEAQRELEKGDAEEAMEQLFRAEHFYNQAVPYSTEPALLRGIYYYYFQARKAAGLEEEARDAYCAYVAVARALAGSVGPIEQFEPLADRCGPTPIAGTAELRVTANVDGAHVFIDQHAVGVVGRELPYVDPFLPAGPHLVEVRKAGYARWGTLVTLEKGDSKSLRADLGRARNRDEEYDPLAELIFRGDDAFGEDYIADLLFQMAERYHVETLISAYLEPAASGATLTIFTHGDDGVSRDEYPIAEGLDGHRPALARYWKARFGFALDPADALPAPDRWAPTLFKVE